jgi:KUP system potassium uptake protein
VVIVSVVFDDTPRVAAANRSHLEHLGDDIWRVLVRYGFVEIPDLPATLRQIKGLDCKADIREAIYFASRDLVVPKARSRMASWRLEVFAWLYRNAVKMTDRFDLPPKNVIEIARQIEI